MLVSLCDLLVLFNEHTAARHELLSPLAILWGRTGPSHQKLIADQQRAREKYPSDAELGQMVSRLDEIVFNFAKLTDRQSLHLNGTLPS